MITFITYYFGISLSIMAIGQIWGTTERYLKSRAK